MRRTFNNIISTLFSLVKFSIIKLLHWNEFIQEREKNMRKIFGEYRRLTNFSLLEYLAVTSDWRGAV